ncbi:MAG: hypothetical protein RR350_07290 [Oscillibacter sp.]
MNTVIAWLLTAISTMAFFLLWFWVVYKELRGKRNTAESAALQLAACRKKRLRAKNSIELADAQAVLDRSLDIYHQAVDIYNKTRQKPLNHIPGWLMGFGPLDEKK